MNNLILPDRRPRHFRQIPTLQKVFAILVLTTLVGCQGTTDVGSQPALALIATMDGDPLTVADMRSGAVVERPSSDLGILGEDARTLNQPDALLYYSGAGKLVCFDLTARAISWTEAIGGNEASRWAGNPLTVVDSIKFLTAADSLSGGVAEMILDQIRRYAYFTTYDNRIHKDDLQSRTYVRSLQLPTHGPLSLSPDGASVYMIDGSQPRDEPGSGFMYVADAELTSAEAIDLNAAAREGLPPQLNSIVASEDGALLYIGAGTPARGPVYGTQHGSVIVLDAHRRTIHRAFALPTWGVRSIVIL